MRKIFAVIFILVLVASSGIGCLASKPAAPAGPTDAARLTVIETWQAGIEKWKTDTTASIADHTKSIDSKATKEYVDLKFGSVTNSGYARSEVDAKITELQAQIMALKNAPATVPVNQQPQQNPPNIITGQVTGTMSPVSVTAWGNGTNANFIYRITNGTNAWQYCKPAIVLSTPSPYSAINTGGLLINMQQGNFTWNNANFDFLPALSTTARASFDSVPMTGGENSLGERFLSPGAWVDINVNIAITSNPITAIWTIAANVRSHQ